MRYVQFCSLANVRRQVDMATMIWLPYFLYGRSGAFLTHFCVSETHF